MKRLANAVEIWRVKMIFTGFQMIWDGPAQGSKVKETDIACLRPARTFKGAKRKDIACLGPTQLSKEKNKNRETNLPTSYYNTTHRLIDETLTPRSGNCWRTPWKILHFTLTFYKRQMNWSSRATCSLRPKIMQWLWKIFTRYDQEKGWCVHSSLDLVMARWATC